MAYYYRYNFTSPEIVYSTVKEELKSYFDTGAVDDLMFPTYVDKGLRKLGRSSYVITEQPLFIEDFQARLPDNFFAVREAWLCTTLEGYPYQTANSFYTEASSLNVVQVSPVTTNIPPCTSCNETPCECSSEKNVYKINNESGIAYQKLYMLKPGNISVRKHCDVSYANGWELNNPAFNNFTPASSSFDSFDIRDNKFVTNFRQGIVHLVFYATEYDGGGNQMIPDNYRIREYIEHFIKYKVFETLTNQTNDETFQQLQQKLTYYKQLSDEAFIMADIEIKKQDIYAKQRRIAQDLNRFNMYELPNRISRNWRRNN